VLLLPCIGISRLVRDAGNEAVFNLAASLNGLVSPAIQPIANFFYRLHVTSRRRASARFSYFHKQLSAFVIVTIDSNPEGISPRLILALICSRTALNTGHFQNP
jgi:hypothetical protein